MKIAHYSTSLSRSAGGLFYSVSGLAKAQLQLGNDVCVVGGVDQYFEQDKEQWGDVSLRTTPTASGSYGLSLATLGQLRSFRPDILHVHGIWSAASVYGRIAVHSGWPVVVSPRGMLDQWILARKPQTKRLHGTLFEKPMLRKAFVHALNSSERNSVVKYMPEAESRVFVLPNGVPGADDFDLSVERSGVLYLGRLHEKKQVIELIDAWISNPDFAAQTLRVAGWGTPQYEDRVRSFAAATKNFEFLGALYAENKSAELRRAKFFILPSLSEGLPMAVLEAIQHGCVPIITEQCNLPELFIDDIAIPMKSDFSDFAEVIKNALSMSNTEFMSRSRAAQSYSQRYLWTNIAQSMLAQYNEILKTS